MTYLIAGQQQSLVQRRIMMYPQRQAVQRRSGGDIGGIGYGKVALVIRAQRPFFRKGVTLSFSDACRIAKIFNDKLPILTF